MKFCNTRRKENRDKEAQKERCGGGRGGAREGELGGSEWGDKREEDAAEISFFSLDAVTLEDGSLQEEN